MNTQSRHEPPQTARDPRGTYQTPCIRDEGKQYIEIVYDPPPEPLPANTTNALRSTSHHEMPALDGYGPLVLDPKGDPTPFEEDSS